MAQKVCDSRNTKLSAELRLEGKHFAGIVGARGTGKTVLLRQYVFEHKDAFYLSADTLEPDDDVWEMIRNLNTHYGFRTFLLDEIRFLHDPTALLERLYDFLDFRILFSRSVALAMQASAHDLSRRVRLLNLHVFSFREFLDFAHGIFLPPLTMAEIAVREWEPGHIRAGQFFDEYLRGGLLPFSLEEPEPASTFLDRQRRDTNKTLNLG